MGQWYIREGEHIVGSAFEWIYTFRYVDTDIQDVVPLDGQRVDEVIDDASQLLQVFWGVLISVGNSCLLDDEVAAEVACRQCQAIHLRIGADEIACSRD